MERSAPSFDDNALFGSVNDLVEGRGLKVIISTNDMAKVNAETQGKDYSENPLTSTLPQGNWRVTCLGPRKPPFATVLSLT